MAFGFRLKKTRNYLLLPSDEAPLFLDTFQGALVDIDLHTPDVAPAGFVYNTVSGVLQSGGGRLIGVNPVSIDGIANSDQSAPPIDLQPTRPWSMTIVVTPFVFNGTEMGLFRAQQNKGDIAPGFTAEISIGSLVFGQLVARFRGDSDGGIGFVAKAYPYAGLIPHTLVATFNVDDTCTVVLDNVVQETFPFIPMTNIRSVIVEADQENIGLGQFVQVFEVRIQNE